MAHFAKIENGIVQQVIVVANSDFGNMDFPASEPIGQAFIASLGLDGEWKQTSYNANFRNVYAGAGYIWNGINFVGPSPFPSWILNSNDVWQAPTPKPEGDFYWDEESLSWLAIPAN